jgi:hypothetical protein
MFRQSGRRGAARLLAAIVLAAASPLAATSPKATCAATGSIVVSYEGGVFEAEVFGNSPYPTEQKTWFVDLEELEPGKSKLCFDILMLESARILTDEIRVKFDNLSSTGIFEPGLESDPKKFRKKEMTFKDAPTSWDSLEYPKGSGGWIEGKRVTFDVKIKLGVGAWQKIDPDVVIKKPGG